MASVYPHKGKFYALDRSLDPKTGSIRYYVTFPNPGNILRPGQFGNVRFVADMKKGAMVIPQEAVTSCRAAIRSQLSARQQGQYSSGKNGRAHRRDVGSHGRSEAG